MLSTHGPIWDLWNAGGPFLGDDARPHHRVTVELGWALQTTVGAVGNLDGSKLPVRWFQRLDNSQVETNLPNVKTIHIVRDISQDAATIEIEIYNTAMSPQGALELGNPGWFTYSRGLSTVGLSEWSHATNVWLKALAPNALLRTFQGYGGYVDGVPSDIPDLVASGNLVQTGTWLVDEVRISTTGTILIRGRDMAKLLVDQYAYPPLVPPNLYPLRYARFYEREVDTPCVLYGTADGNKRWILGIEPDPAGDGYWLVGDDGGVFSYGNSWYYGSLGGEFSHEVTMIARTQSGAGYWLCRTNGNVYTFGDAIYSGGQVSPAHPIICIEAAGHTGHGYWLLSNAGDIYTFGGAGYYGGNPGGASQIVDMASTKTGLGYWLLDDHGHVYSFGDAVYYGNGSYTGSSFTAIGVTPSGQGYYLVDKVGHVYTQGDAVYHGGTSGIVLDDPIQDIAVDPNGRGYWLAASDGGVFTFGTAPGTHFNTPTTSVTILDDLGISVGTVTAITVVDAHHLTFTLAAGLAPGTYQVVVASDYTVGISLLSEAYSTTLVIGGSSPDPVLGSITVAPSSIAGNYPDTTLLVIGALDGAEPLQFYGSLPGATTDFFPFDGNYLDLADIIKDILLWAGFWLEGAYDATTRLPVVYGNIETTGIYVNDPIPISTFDKLPLVNGLQKIREIVGYFSWVDEAGAYHWQSPNWYTRGNFLPDGVHTNTIPVIREKRNLQSLGISAADKDQRSSITISSSQPFPDTGGPPIPGTITTTAVPTPPAGDPIGLDALKGLVKPALWVNLNFISAPEQQQMAELIAQHLWWQQRLASVQIAANPCICLDDQVAILERQADEGYVHYVRAIDSSADLDSGKWTMTLTTNWLAEEAQL